MTYTTSTINSANCATDFLSALDTAMQVSSHYTRIENYPTGGAQGYVWKSDGTLNHPNGTTGGSDFYISAYTATAASTVVYFTIHEAYDQPNHLASRYIPYDQTTYGYDSTYKWCTNGAQLINTLPNSTPMANGYVTIAVSSQFSYFFNINHHRVFIGVRTATPADSGIFLGQCENLIDTSLYSEAAVCLAMVNGTGTTSKGQTYTWYRYRTGWTREPGTTATSGGNWSGLTCTTGGYAMYPWFPGSDTYDSVYKPSAYYVGRAPMYSTRDNANLFQPRSLLPLGTLAAPRHSTAVNGDTLTLGGVTYYHCTLGPAASTSHFFAADVHTHA